MAGNSHNRTKRRSFHYLTALRERKRRSGVRSQCSSPPLSAASGRGAHSTPLSPWGRGVGGEGVHVPTTRCPPHPSPLPPKAGRGAHSPPLAPSGERGRG